MQKAQQSLASTKQTDALWIKLLILGDTGVGKSSLMHRYAKGEFAQGLIGTAGVDHVSKNIEHMNKSVKIQIWDTAGQDRFREPALQYYRGAVGIILVFDVTDEKSFANVDYWLNRIQENGDEGSEIILIGNKIDMINEVRVDRTIAQNVADNHKIQYFETSAKDASNLDLAMKTLISNIITNPSLASKIDANANVHIGSTKPKTRKNNQNCCR